MTAAAVASRPVTGVGDRVEHLLAGGLDAVVQERAASRLAAGEILDLLARPGRGPEREHDALPVTALARTSARSNSSPYLARRSSGVSRALLMSHAIGAPTRSRGDAGDRSCPAA